MAYKDSQFEAFKLPAVLMAGAALVVALGTTVALLFGDRRETAVMEVSTTSQKIFDQIAAPVSDVLSVPVRATHELGRTSISYFGAVDENQRLKAEVAELRVWKDRALALEDLNDRYRDLLGLRVEPPIAMATAQTISDSHGPFANRRLINAGSDQGIREGNPVMSEHGLIGRIVGVSPKVSRVILLSDTASRVPVMVDRTNARAVLSGDGGSNPPLEYLRGRDPIRTGDRIVTSGDGGVFPRGLPVGVAVKGIDGRWRVVLDSESTPVDYVRILLFQDFGQLADAARLEPRELPSIATEDPIARARSQSILAPTVKRPTSGHPIATKPAGTVARR